MKMQYKSFNVYRNGVLTAEAQYPANADNCWWFDIAVWTEGKGFIDRAEYELNGNHYALQAAYCADDM